MKWKKSIRIFNNILTTLLFIALLFTMILVVSSNLTGEDTSLLGYQLKSVLSGSMEPDIKTGSIIAIKSGIDMTDLEEGDVITFFTEEESFVTHRIVEIPKEGGQYITKGDANNRNDLNPVLAENIIGEYKGFTIPFAGYLIGFSSSKTGIFILLIVPGILLTIHSFIIIWRVMHYVSRSESKVKSEID